MVFDKTGTLTYGRPTVTDVVTSGIEAKELLTVATSVEAHSEHPLGQSITFYAKREGADPMPVTDFRAVPGKGVTASFNGGRIVAGKPGFINEEDGRISEELLVKLKVLAEQGKTVVVFTRDGLPLGAIALQDTPRRGADRLISKMKKRGSGR